MTHNDNRRLDDETQVMPRIPRSDDTVVMSPLIGQLMEASIRQTQEVTNALVDSLTYQEAQQRATLELVREAIIEIANRSYVANPYLYLQALHPSQEDVLERMHHNDYQKG